MRHNVGRYRAQLTEQLRIGGYVFSPCYSIEYKPGKYLNSFRSCDAIVLKMLALAFNQVLPKSPLCYSWKGHGGVAKALSDALTYQPVFYAKTDVSNYYASVSHYYVMEKLSKFTTDEYLLRLVYCAIEAASTDVGLPRGSAFSHVVGNFYLHELDVKFEGRDSQCYVRYMDDILLLTQHKGALRRGVKTIRQEFEQLNLTWSYQKSHVGRWAKQEN
ncbi:RNA-directed DNA polymerase, partial [Vibrio paucivorans]